MNFSIATSYETQPQAVCISRDSHRIVKFLSWGDFNQDIFSLLIQGYVFAVYLENGALVAEDLDGTIYRDILK